jgi:hypothetical protein
VKFHWWLVGAIIVVAVGCSPTWAVPGQAGQGAKNVENNPWQKLVDSVSAGKVPVVLRVRLLNRQGSDKFGWDMARLVGVIKNTSNFKFPDEFLIAHYSGEPGIPDGQSTVYLQPYNPTSDNLWMLLEGSGNKGVSHHQAD